MEQYFIAPYSKGLTLNKKPFLIPDNAFSTLENAYVWRDRVKKRQGLRFLGRLRRILETESLGNSGASPWTFNIYSTLIPAITGEPNASIQPGTVLISIGAITFTDISPTLTTPDGTLVSNTVANSGTINYSTGSVTLIHTSGAGVATTISFNYYPSLPVMGLREREQPGINEEETVAFDTKYAYKYFGSGFQELVTGTTWTGDDSEFFWTTNYRGIEAFTRLFFATNYNIDDPIRYYNPALGGSWTDFAPGIGGATPTTADTTFLFQAKILIPYYGRLLAFNTWEGTKAPAPNNFFNRCRFSQIGDPTQATVVGPPFVGGAWRSDVFGKGGFVDAPTNEEIVSVEFFKNTLIVGFEETTWQLRYVGEYGLPFIWERVSSDFGTESTFSTVLFDKGVLTVGDRAITISGSSDVARIDSEIPDVVFNFRNAGDGVERVHGIRDFQRELVFWNYSDSQLQRKFPNKILVYNYINETFAIFRDNTTCFGIFQPGDPITWDRLDIFWDDEEVTWDYVDAQSNFPYIIVGNAQGFVLFYGYTTLDEGSLSITAVDLTVTPIKITVPDHNIEDNEIIYIRDLLFTDSLGVPTTTDLNDNFYQVVRNASGSASNELLLYKWDGDNYASNFTFTPATTSIYVGNGTVALIPKLNVMTKDFNPYVSKGYQVKLSSIDFLTDVPVSDSVTQVAMSVNVFMNTALAVKGNLLVGNQSVETSTSQPYYIPGSDLTWHRFYAMSGGNFLRIQMTYDDVLMNDINTHRNDWVLNAISLSVRTGGKSVF